MTERFSAPAVNRIAHAARRCVLLGLLVAAAFGCIVIGSPATAHASALDNTGEAGDYRSRITTLRPTVGGLSLRIVQQGTRVELINHTGASVEVLGYSHERYLRVDHGAAYVNEYSPSTYINEDLGSSSPPDNIRVDKTAAPHWRRIGNSGSVRWHDHRTHVMGGERPRAVTTDPHHQHRIFNWRLALRVGGKPVQVSGVLEYFPHPATGLWWAAAVVLASAVIALGLTRAGLPIISMFLAAAAASALADSTGRALDYGARGWGVIGHVITSQAHCAVVALAALIAAGLAWRRAPIAPFAIGLSGICLAILCGVTNISVFEHAEPAAPWSGTLARVGLLLTLGAGLGVSAAGWLRVRRERALLRGVPAASVVSTPGVATRS